MAREKLTKRQSEALQRAADGVVFEVNCGTGAWRIFGASPTVVGRLRAMGLLAVNRYDDHKYRFDPTEAGRQALAEETGDA